MIQPTLKQLRYLIALDEAQNFSKAAEKCFVTQSTLSASITDLEEIVGLKLVERTRKYQGLTNEGKEIIKRASEILTLTQDLMEYSQSQKEPLTGDLKLGAIPTIAPFILPELTTILAKKFPNLKLSLVESQSATLVKQVREGSLDIAILAFPYPTLELKTQILGLDKLALLTPEDDPLSKLKFIPPEKLKGENLLLLEDGNCLKDHAMAVCKIKEISKPNNFEATSLLTLALMVEMKQGYTIVPEMAIRSGFLNGLKVKTVPISQTPEGRDIGVIWRKTCPREKDFTLLSEALKDLL